MPAFPDPQFSLLGFRIPVVFLLFAACARLSVVRKNCLLINIASALPSRRSSEWQLSGTKLMS
jgi:hypothetical protein